MDFGRKRRRDGRAVAWVNLTLIIGRTVVLPPLFLLASLCPAVSCLSSEAPSCASAATCADAASTANTADNIAAADAFLRRRRRFSIP